MKDALRGAYPRLLALPAWQRRGLAASLLGAVAVASSLPAGGGGAMPTGVSFLLNWGHQFLYAALAVGLAAGLGTDLGRARPAALAGLVLMCAAVGLLDEIHQGGLARRESSAWDLGSDLLGAALGLACARWTLRAAGPVFPPGATLFCLGLSLSWNCAPAFLPNFPLSELLP